MIKIALISDTHSFVDDLLIKHLKESDEIWHAGDIGNIRTADLLNSIKPLKAVHGNIDGQDIRVVYPKHQRFSCEGLDVWITHIGGYPGNYSHNVKPGIFTNPPGLFISGHSHILKVQYDKKLDLLHVNPGAAGNNGLHQLRTLVRFTIDGKEIKDMAVVELQKRW